MPRELRRWLTWGINRYFSGRYRSLEAALGIIGRGHRADEATEDRYAAMVAAIFEWKLAGRSWRDIIDDVSERHGVTDEREVRRIFNSPHYQTLGMALLTRKALSQPGDQ